MKKILGLAAILAAGLMLTVNLQADQTTPTAGTTTPVAKANPSKASVHKKAKKAKKAAKKETKTVWACPMGDYSGPKTADGKCPKCGMDLVEQK